MTDIERATAYAAIFVNVGERWRGFVPVDAQVRGDVVQLGTATISRQDDGSWLVRESFPAGVVRVAVEVVS